jgi:osmotically inducible protein OsmC
MTTSRASAVWEGKLRDGKGSFKAASGTFKGDYSFRTRFEGAPGSTPEELIAAAHAACFSMALSVGLEQAGTPATRVETEAACTIEKVGDGFKITTMDLKVRGKDAGIDQAEFQQDRGGQERVSGVGRPQGQCQMPTRSRIAGL